MTNNPTIDGVARELLERLLVATAGDSTQANPAWYVEELRALLDAPVVERQPVAPFYISAEDWNLLVRGDVEIASVRVSRTRRSKFTESLFAYPPEVAALQSTIAQLRQHKNDYMEAAEETRKALTDEVAHLQAQVSELESGRGEPFTHMRINVDGNPYRCRAEDHGDSFPIYRYPPAPVAVVLPDRAVKDDGFFSTHLKVAGWNACLDATAALNGVRK